MYNIHITRLEITAEAIPFHDPKPKMLVRIEVGSQSLCRNAQIVRTMKQYA